MFRSTFRPLLAAGLLVTTAGAASAQVTTDPYLFENPFTSPTGTFEWDTFKDTDDGGPGFTGPHTPDVGSSGTGSASISANGFVPSPNDGPPFGVVTSTSNLYSGGTTGTYTLDLTGLDDTQANTTLVMQVAYIPGNGPFTGFELDGESPTESVDRGVAQAVKHGVNESPFDTTYLWFEWQVDASETAQITFDTLEHTSLTAVRIDYINSSSLVDAADPSLVPEPGSLALLGLGGLALLARRRRACRAG